jgi:DNA polymerase-3 subunit epsilon
VLGLFTSPPWDEPVYWALDLETGGLDARRDPILAVGMVPVRGGHLRLGEAYESLVRPGPGEAIHPESVRAHQLVPGDLEAAPRLAEVLAEVDRRLGGGVLLVHHRAVDVAFLEAAHRRAGARFRRPAVVDTAALLVRAAEKARRATPELPADRPSLKLSDARAARGLPPYPEHDALADAIATAELFLALRAELGARRLRDLT